MTTCSGVGNSTFVGRADEIKVLPSLLYEARSARRVVVFLSDHGHLLDVQTQLVRGEGGERWRQDDGRPGEGELTLRGPRVLLAEGNRLIAPWTERLRYGIRKNGYHGGITPQEMLIPITVLVAGDLRPDGWSEVTDPTPEWWEPAPAVTVPSPIVQPLKSPPRKPPENLFDPPLEEEPTPPGPVPTLRPAWITALLASPVFAEQKKLGGRVVPEDDDFRWSAGGAGRCRGQADCNRLGPWTPPAALSTADTDGCRSAYA